MMPEALVADVEERHVTISSAAIEFFRMFGRRPRPLGEVTGWPALLAPEQIDPAELDLRNPARVVSIDLRWDTPPHAGRHCATVEHLGTERRGGATTSIYHSAIASAGVVLATCATRYVLALEPSRELRDAGRARLNSEPHDAGARCWSRTINVDEAAEYRAAVGLDLVSRELLLPGRPCGHRRVIPAAFLVSEALRIVGCPTAGRLQVSFPHPCFVGAALHWAIVDQQDGIHLTAKMLCTDRYSMTAVVEPQGKP